MSGPDELLAEADRQFTICNACRYCEDYCAVFPAMERLSQFTEGDLGYLASICHDCRACYQACMYTEPHDFAINIPALMAASRLETYAAYARPRWLSRAFNAGPGGVALLNLAALAVLVVVYAAVRPVSALTTARTGAGALYRTVGHLAMAVPALVLSAYGVGVLAVGLVLFWRDGGGSTRELLDLRLWAIATREAATHRWMRGGGGECYFPQEEKSSPLRRRLHAAVLYGFVATFAATVTAFVAEAVLGDAPPYPLLSAPVLLGVVGGVAVVSGTVGMLWLARDDDTGLSTAGARRSGRAFTGSLLAVAVTGLLLFVLRDGALMGALLIVHLATVLALYLTLPYGRMVHAAYRLVALLRSVRERTADARSGR